VQNQPFDEAVELSESESVEEPPKQQQAESLNMDDDDQQSGDDQPLSHHTLPICTPCSLTWFD
jgi:hypothetical protein